MLPKSYANEPWKRASLHIIRDDQGMEVDEVNIFPKPTELFFGFRGHTLLFGSNVHFDFAIAKLQNIVQGALHWYLDGVHNEMSVVESAAWFIESVNMKTFDYKSKCLLLY
jgi:hypothetical protein